MSSILPRITATKPQARLETAQAGWRGTSVRIYTGFSLSGAGFDGRKPKAGWPDMGPDHRGDI
jgi:hypothetical protein